MKTDYFYARYRSILFDKESRFNKAEKIYKLLNKFSNVDIKSANILDIGCSAGLITFWFSDKCTKITGIDIDNDTLEFLNDYKSSHNFSNVEFKFASADKLPFENANFDIIICNTMYYLLSPTQQFNMLNEMRRCLKANGIVYFAGVNKYILIEGKFKLPLLTWLPHNLGKLYVKIFKSKMNFDEYYWSYKQFGKYFKNYFYVNDVTFEVIDNLFEYGMIRSSNQIMQSFISFFIRVFRKFIPNYIFILKAK